MECYRRAMIKEQTLEGHREALSQANKLSLKPADVMRTQYHMAGFRILEWMNYSDNVIEHYERTLSAPPNKLTNRVVLGDDAPERQRNSQRNLIEGRTIYWMITAERPKL